MLQVFCDSLCQIEIISPSSEQSAAYRCDLTISSPSLLFITYLSALPEALSYLIKGLVFDSSPNPDDHGIFFTAKA